MPSICPRRPAVAEVARLVALDGQVRATRCTGSSRCGRGLRQRVVHRDPPGGAEREFARIDAVEAAVGQRHRDIDHREAERSLDHRIAHALLDRGDILLRNGAARDLLGEAEAFAARQRRKLDHHVAELAVPARLLLVAAALA